MDFKSILNKLDSMEAPPKGIAAPELPKSVKLDEDAQLRVLAGTSTILAESALMEKAMSQAQQKAAGAALSAKRGDTPKSELKGASKEMLGMSEKELEKIAGTKHKGLPKKKTDEAVKEEMKTGDKKPSSTGGTIEKTATGVKHHAGKHYGGDKAPKDEDDDKKSKKVKESAKPDFLDVDGDGDKKEPMKKAAADKGGDKKDGNKGMSAKQAKYFGKKNESVAEAEEKRAPAKKSEREVELPSGAKVKATKVQGWQSQKADKEAKKDANESVESSKELVAESTLTFAKALKIIKESNGTAQIDPLDTDLWKWARRVAENKFTESVKIDVYAATTYERMGGTWSIVQITE